jgi:hypothetical protein
MFLNAYINFIQPKPKLPLSEKFLFLNSNSLTLSPFSKISSALSPLTVT